MKKIFIAAIFLSSFAAIAANNTWRVFINGKPIGDAVLVNGVVALPLEDLAKAGGSTVSLEPAFQLQGNRLMARAGWDIKKNVKANAAAPGEQKVKLSDISISHTYDKASPMMFRVAREGTISTHVVTLNGKALVPLADVAKAFGGVWTQPAGGLAPGAAIQLNFTSNPQAILVGM